jgi:hypothetical protein
MEPLDGLEGAFAALSDHPRIRAQKLAEQQSTRAGLEWPMDAGIPTDDRVSAAERLGGDAVNLPSHYARFKIEPIRFLVENFGPVILVGKVVKYVLRYDAKNGLEDIRKAKRCISMLEKFVMGDADWWKADRNG